MTGLDLFEVVRDRLFAYDIFPPRVIRFGLCPEGPLSKGTTIVQRVRLGPISLEMAVRVIAAWDLEEDGAREAGYTYATVKGHPECGTASFRVMLDRNGNVDVVVEARSRPGLLVTRLGRPLARVFQRGITLVAMRQLGKGK
jgi:uncharacterized protein (UPF0548 family)